MSGGTACITTGMACNNASLERKEQPWTIAGKLTKLLCLVEALQSRGKIGTITGDGAHDTLALEQADIGIAIGTRTDVARETTNMLLTDGNFSY
ncbi:MAG TPA: hypothetical protein V6C50_11145 [Crinalium sp.]